MTTDTPTRTDQLRTLYDQLNALLQPDEAFAFPILDHLGDLIRMTEQDEAQKALRDVQKDEHGV